MLKLLDNLPTLSFPEKLAYLTHQFHKAEQTECPVTHLFKDGFYIREMTIPAGTLFIGRVHRQGHICELVAGSIVHITEYERRALEAPFSLKTTPGYQMALYAVNDVVGRTYHPDSGERDLDKLEECIFESVETLKALGESVERRLTCQA